MAEKMNREPAEAEENATANQGNNIQDGDEVSVSEKDSRKTAETRDRGKQIFLELNKWQDDDDESITEGIADLNLSKERQGTTRNIVLPLQLFTLYINHKMPITLSNKDKPQVLIIHSDSGCKDAEDLSKNLSEHKEKSCRVITLSQIEPLLMVQPHDFKKAAFEWAHVIISIIDESWLDDIEDCRTTSERKQSSLERRYEHACLQNIFVGNASMNLKQILVSKEEIGSRLRTFPEFSTAININDVEQIADDIIELHKMARFVQN